MGDHRYRFTKDQRLLTPHQFKYVFDNTHFRYSTPALLILAAKPSKDVLTNDSMESAPSKLGLVVAKKHLKKAVDRNTFKRVVRESFRENQDALQGLHCVVLVRSKAKQMTQQGSGINKQEIRAILDHAWPYIIRKYRKSTH